MKTNVVLIGMPGVGKSTAGVILAKVLNYDFLDSDLLIQKKMGQRLKDIIRCQGVDGFNAIENQINREIQVEKTVIATGGSAVYGKSAMEHFRKIGVIVYLKISYDGLDHRLGDLKQRGVVHREGQTLWDLYCERCVLYERYADVTVDLDGKTVAETVDDVLAVLEKKSTKE